MRISRRALGIGAAAGLFGFGRSGAARELLPALPLSFAVAELDGEPVVDARWLDAQVAEARRLLEPHGVTVESFRRRRLAAAPRLETADDRDALAVHLEDEVINVFVVATLRDIDDPERLRMGVRWRLRRNVKKDYIIVAANAWYQTLCHELGHFFGNGHSSVVDNIMSYKRRNPLKVTFDEHQGRRMRQVVRQLIASGRVVPANKLRARSRSDPA